MHLSLTPLNYNNNKEPIDLNTNEMDHTTAGDNMDIEKLTATALLTLREIKTEKENQIKETEKNSIRSGNMVMDKNG